MSYGAEFYNSAGKLQIGLGVNNFYLVGKGTFTMTSGTDYKNVNPGVSHDIMVVSCANGFVSAPQFNHAAAATTWVVAKTHIGVTLSVNYWCFRSYKALTPPASGFGLQIYNADGTLGFTSDKPKLMRSVSAINIPNNTPFTSALPSGKTFAFGSYGSVIDIELYTEADPELGTLTFHYYKHPAIKLVGTTLNIEVSAAQATPLSGGPSGVSVYHGGILVVDVTNYTTV